MNKRMDELTQSIQFWTKIQYIGIPLIAAIAGGAFYLYSQLKIDRFQLEQQELSKNLSQLTISKITIEKFSQKEGIVLAYWLSCIGNPAKVIFQKSSISLTETINHVTNEEIVRFKDKMYGESKELFVSEKNSVWSKYDFGGVQIADEPYKKIVDKTSFPVWMLELTYVDMKTNERRKFTYLVKFLTFSQTSANAVDIIINENAPDKIIN